MPFLSPRAGLFLVVGNVPHAHMVPRTCGHMDETGPKSIGVVFVLVCGHHPRHFWLGLVRFGGRLASQIDEFRPDP